MSFGPVKSEGWQGKGKMRQYIICFKDGRIFTARTKREAERMAFGPQS